MGRAERVTRQDRALEAAAGVARAAGVVRAAGIAQVAGMARPVALAGARLLPVRPDLADLVPDRGLRRGTTMTVAAGASPVGVTSLALALAAGASAAGSWCGVVTVPDLGMVAAGEAGLDLARVALVPEVVVSQWAVTVGALVDAVDVVIASPPPHLRAGEARRLSARARERGAVLIVLPARGQAWGEGPDVSLTVTAARWQGPDQGHHHLTCRQIEVEVRGRRAADRFRKVVPWLPAPPAPMDAPGAAFAGADFDAGLADAETGFAGADFDAGLADAGFVDPPSTGTAG